MWFVFWGYDFQTVESACSRNLIIGAPFSAYRPRQTSTDCSSPAVQPTWGDQAVDGLKLSD
jgi:hypothetical protein